MHVTILRLFLVPLRRSFSKFLDFSDLVYILLDTPHEAPELLENAKKWIWKIKLRRLGWKKKMTRENRTNTIKKNKN